MKPHGAVGILEFGEQRLEARIIERHAQDIGVQLYAQRTELSQSTVELAQGLVDVAQRQRSRESGEAVWKPLDQFRHLVIGDAGKLRRDSRRPDLFKRWHGKHQDLGIIAVWLDLPPPCVQVGQHRIEGEDALAVVVESARSHGFRELPLQPLKIRTRQDVRERIDLPHV